MDGIIIVNKEKDMTSRDVVNIACKVLNTKKIGHTGTLDPIATGVLVLCVNKATKLVDLLTSEEKEYVAEVKLGMHTSTLDIEGEVLNEEPYVIQKDKLVEILNSFVKTYMQEVPIYSSVKVGGRKLYEYARNNEKVTLPKKEVTIKKIELLAYDENTFTFKVLVSKGTYIRSLIRDIATKLSTYGTMTDLIRTRNGSFRLEDAISIDELKNGSFEIKSMRNFLDAKVVEITSDIATKVFNGHKLEIDDVSHYILFVLKDKDVALYKKDGNYYKAYKVFNNSWKTNIFSV